MHIHRNERPDPQGPAKISVAQDKLVQPIGFATGALPAVDRFDAWRDHCASVVDITESLSQEPDYDATG